MNYRHHYHAGNFADVMKHLVLMLVLEHLRIKPAPFAYFDSHAGIGRYRLDQEPALKTGEFAGGIGRLLETANPPPPVARYLDLVRSFNSGPSVGGFTPLLVYPGSPRLAGALRRPLDRLVLAEFHPEDAALLRRDFRGVDRVEIYHADGFQALKGWLPPRERRGLLLIDPPYENPDEFAQVATALETAARRWPSGLFAAWYPIKDRSAVWQFHEAVAKLAIARTLIAEMLIRSEERWDRLNGCGMVLINPPWQLDATLTGLLPWLSNALNDRDEPAGGACSRVEWLVPESQPGRGNGSQGSGVL